MTQRRKYGKYNKQLSCLALFKVLHKCEKVQYAKQNKARSTNTRPEYVRHKLFVLKKQHQRKDPHIDVTGPNHRWDNTVKE